MFDVTSPVGKVFGLLRQELTSDCMNECATCSTCRGQACGVQNLNRGTLCAGERAAQCDAYQACLDQQNCAGNPRSCYCGTVDTTACFADAATATTPNGKCRDAANALAGTTLPKEVGRQMGDNTTPLGAISELVTCRSTSCQSMCSPATGGSGGNGGNGGTSGNAGRSGGGSGG
jgi:hypothetical protein